MSFILTRRYYFSHSTYRKRHRVKINDNSRPTKLRAKERAFVTSHVNIYVRGKGQSLLLSCGIADFDAEILLTVTDDEDLKDIRPLIWDQLDMYITQTKRF